MNNGNMTVTQGAKCHILHKLLLLSVQGDMGVVNMLHIYVLGSHKLYA